VIGLFSVLVAASPLLTVDLQAAVLATRDGDRARRSLERAVAAAEADARRRRDRLLARRGELDEAAFEAERRALNARVDARESELARLEAELLDPILDALDGMLADVGRRAKAPVLDVPSGRIAGQPAACDLTKALATAHDEETAIAVPRGCVPALVVGVDLGRAVERTEAARRILEARDADRRRLAAALAAVPAGPEGAARVEALQAQMDARDDLAREALAAAAQRAMTRQAASHPRTVWLAVEPDRLRAAGSVCDGTALVRAALGPIGSSGRPSDCPLPAPR
jgi:Skp family chaperone for outer membrane proteins